VLYRDFCYDIIYKQTIGLFIYLLLYCTYTDSASTLLRLVYRCTHANIIIPSSLNVHIVILDRTFSLNRIRRTLNNVLTDSPTAYPLQLEIFYNIILFVDVTASIHFRLRFETLYIYTHYNNINNNNNNNNSNKNNNNNNNNIMLLLKYNSV